MAIEMQEMADASLVAATGGRVESLQLCPGHREPMRPVTEVEAIAEQGLAGDAHNKPRGSRQVLLMDAEALATLGLTPGIIKENITTRGIAVNRLPPGQQLQIGATVVLEVTQPCEPCFRMEEIRPGLQIALEGQRGMLARIVTGGTIRQGDAIRVLRDKG